MSQQQHAVLDLVQRRSQGQHLPAKGRIASTLGMVRAQHTPPPYGVWLLEFEPEFLAGLPDQFAGPRRTVARYQKMEVFRNSDLTFHLDRRAAVGNPHTTQSMTDWP